MIIEELVTNRSSTASYGAGDLNRVNSAVQYITEELAANGYTIPLYSTTDWKITDIPTLQQLNGYLANVQSIKAVVMARTRLPGTMNKSQYTDWNNIEKLLQEAHNLIQNMIAAYCYAGDFYVGEV